MSPIASPSIHTPARRRRRVPAPKPRVRAPRATASSSRRRRELCGRPARLGGYLDSRGRRRELVALDGGGGSLLVVDRDAATLCDRRLIAHLGAEEPAGNALLVSRSYLSCPSAPRCRRLLPSDLHVSPAGEGGQDGARRLEPAATIEAAGHVHLLREVPGERSRPRLRWCRRDREHPASGWEPVRLRDVVAALESYEPMRSITAAALGRHRDQPGISVRQLQGEYQWLCTSPVVLNRALREAVLRAIDSEGLSMSEIALRCGVVKRDRHGKRSGETSWLARRVGLMPESGATRITPWIHSEVLAVIARDGLRLSPREVEVP